MRRTLTIVAAAAAAVVAVLILLGTRTDVLSRFKRGWDSTAKDMRVGDCVARAWSKKVQAYTSFDVAALAKLGQQRDDTFAFCACQATAEEKLFASPLDAEVARKHPSLEEQRYFAREDALCEVSLPRIRGHRRCDGNWVHGTTEAEEVHA